MASYTINEFVAKMNGVLSSITNDILDITETIGNTATVLISERIIDTGKNGSNKRLGVYSPSTKKQKKKKGYESSFVNLKQSGDMWKDIGVVSNDSVGKNITTVVGGRNAVNSDTGVTTTDKMEFNSERYGDFMTLTNKEEKQIAKAFDGELQIVLDKYFK